jgi:hypothetical protein
MMGPLVNAVAPPLIATGAPNGMPTPPPRLMLGSKQNLSSSMN